MREAVVQFGRIGAVAPAPEIGEQRTNHPTRHGTPGKEVAGLVGGKRQLADERCALLGIQELRWTQIATDQQSHVSNIPFGMRNQKASNGEDLTKL